MSIGSATTDHQFAYFMPHGSNKVYSYQLNTEVWGQLPPCPCNDSGLVIIDGSLTTVGRKVRILYEQTITLRQGEWVSEYPPMNSYVPHLL